MHRTVICALGALLALAACTRKLDNARAEKAVADQFTAFFPIERVSCPKGVTLAAGATFVCTVKFTGGDEFKVDARIREIQGDQERYDLKLDEPVFDPKGTAAWLTDELSRRHRLEAKVDCGAPRHPGADDSCTATAIDGTIATVALKLGPDGKPESFELR